jgi:hypothetical protein
MEKLFLGICTMVEEVTVMLSGNTVDATKVWGELQRHVETIEQPEQIGRENVQGG